MEVVEMHNSKGTRKFSIWGGIAVHTTADGSERRVELSAPDLFTGTVLDNVKALVGTNTPAITRTSSTVDCNGIALYIALDNPRYEYIELKGWEL